MKPFARLFQCLAAAGLCLGAGTAVGAGAIVIGYTNCVAVTNLSPSAMNQVAQFKWFFAHASVGDNLMQGITDLHATNATLFPLTRYSASATPPAQTRAGIIYDYNRGNPGWQPKVDSFGTYASNGWCFPTVHLAVNKFCYIDSAADVNYYIRSMTNLEAAFPQTLFVYVTLPLTTTADWSFSSFNNTLRNWVLEHNRVLLDLADIEAHDTNGVLQTAACGTNSCQRLFAGYTSDGGHVNAAGRQLAALGFYALGAALLSSDRDGDGASDGEELMAGTNPQDPASVFRITQASKLNPGQLVLQWRSSAGCAYTLQAAQGVSSGFSNLLDNLPATPPMNSHTTTLANPGPQFFRLKVR